MLEPILRCILRRGIGPRAVRRCTASSTARHLISSHCTAASASEPSRTEAKLRAGARGDKSSSPRASRSQRLIYCAGCVGARSDENCPLLCVCLYATSVKHPEWGLCKVSDCRPVFAQIHSHAVDIVGTPSNPGQSRAECDSVRSLPKPSNFDQAWGHSLELGQSWTRVARIWAGAA